MIQGYVNRMAGCFGKDAFGDGGIAKDVAKAQRRRRNADVIAYRCKGCGRWHVGAPNMAKRPIRELTTDGR